MSREELIGIYKDVVEELNNGYYVNDDDDVVHFDTRALTTSRVNDPKRLTPDDRLYEDFPTTRIYVENKDFLTKACEMDAVDSAILNPASAKKAGGGVRTGARALEEIICRRSTLLGSLEKYADSSGYYTDPLKTYEVIYSTGVSIFRNEDYSFMTKPKIINVISAAAINRPLLDASGRYYTHYERLMKGKIRAVLRVAIMNGIVNLVLPAWGCGAFQNPATEVARCFKEVFEEYEFAGAFEEICFAILDDHNSFHEFNPDGNYEPFVNTFGLKP